jgi:hypothetical protein
MLQHNTGTGEKVLLGVLIITAGCSVCTAQPITHHLPVLWSNPENLGR